MNDYKKEYLDNKEKIAKCLSDAQKFFEENGFEHEAGVIGDNLKSLEKGEFSIAVVGEFSNGKSTFLNALMGEKILPSYTNETTATVNFLRHKSAAKEGEAGEVFFKNGTSEKIYDTTLNTISKYVSTESDIDVAKRVDHLDLYLDSKFLEGNVTLVDTPGLNGMAEGHREITMEQIERSGAGIFMFNANQPGKRSDFEFLSALCKNVKSVLLLLNRIDEVSEKELDSVIDRLKENYKKVYPDIKTIPELWPVAAYPALIARSKQDDFSYRGRKGGFTDEEKKDFEEKSRMEAFEDRLWKFLTQGEKAKQELLSPISKLIEQLSNVYKNIDIQLNVLNGAADDSSIKEQILELENTISGLNDRIAEQTKDIKKAVNEAEEDFYNEINVEVDRFGDRYLKQIDTFENIDEIEPEYVQKKLERIADGAYENYCRQIRLIAVENTADITAELEKTLSANMDIKIDSSFEIPSIEVGLEEFDKVCDDYKKKIEEQEQAVDAAQDDVIAARKAERKKKALEKQLDAAKASREDFERNFDMFMPAVDKHYEPKTEKTGWWIFKKKKVVYEEVTNTKDRDEYIKRQEEIREEYNKEIKDLKNQLSGIADEDIAGQEQVLRRKIKKEEELKTRLESYQKEFAENMKKKYSDALNKLKKNLKWQLEDVKHEYIKDVKKEFKNRCDIHVNTMEQLISQSVRAKLDTKKKELEILNNRLNDAVKEKESSINKLKVQQEGVRKRLQTAHDLKFEIDSIRVDRIEEQDI